MEVCQGRYSGFGAEFDRVVEDVIGYARGNDHYGGVCWGVLQQLVIVFYSTSAIPTHYIVLVDIRYAPSFLCVLRADA